MRGIGSPRYTNSPESETDEERWWRLKIFSDCNQPSPALLHTPVAITTCISICKNLSIPLPFRHVWVCEGNFSSLSYFLFCIRFNHFLVYKASSNSLHSMSFTQIMWYFPIHSYPETLSKWLLQYQSYLPLKCLILLNTISLVLLHLCFLTALLSHKMGVQCLLKPIEMTLILYHVQFLGSERFCLNIRLFSASF